MPNYGKFSPIHGTSPEELTKLNDQMRYLFNMVQGRIGTKEISAALRNIIDSKAGSSEIEQLSDQIALRVVKGSLGGANLLVNSSFEDEAGGWTPQGSGISYPAGRVSGKCVAMIGAFNQTRYLRQTLSMNNASGKFTISGYVRTYGVVHGSTNPTVAIYVGAVDGADVVHYPGVTVLATGTTPWTRYSRVIDPTGWETPTIKTIHVYAYIRDINGTVYFDDFQLEEGTEPTAWKPNAHEMQGSSLTVYPQKVQIDTQLFELVLRSATDPEKIDMILQAGGGGFNQLTTAELTVAGERMGVQAAKNLYCSPGAAPGGDGSAGAPFSDPQEAIDSLNKYLAGQVNVYLNSGTYTGNLTIQGFWGPGRLQITTNAASADVVINGVVQITGCTANITVAGTASSRIRVNCPAVSDTATCVSITRCAEVSLVYVAADGVGNLNSANSRGIVVGAARAYLYKCDMARVKHGVYAIYNSIVHVRSCFGGANIISGYGMYAVYGALIHAYHYPTAAVGASYSQAATVNLLGDALTSTYFGGTAPTLPVTRQFEALAIRSYRPSESYWFNGSLRQGNFGYGNHVGCMWFPAVKGGGAGQIPAGKTISHFTGAKIYWKRDSSSGSSGAQWVYLFTLDGPKYGGGGAAQVGTSHGAVCKLSWGQGGWFNIPVQAAFDVYNGKGLCIYTASGSPYVVMDPAVMPVLEITYT